jgi:hypothetical protein
MLKLGHATVSGGKHELKAKSRVVSDISEDATKYWPRLPPAYTLWAVSSP